ncbi:MAG: HDOD domain-containing protein [Uliginosibacterium sp.]|nr:HDOD domain-containing protein [Uliginosibacterium sp.]MBK9395127.1 HDOD domain-containing protein [Uliginosibacterium sp.]MBK9617309.1 HDOD domain-containing protein [Uliginosibacterium sp.]
MTETRDRRAAFSDVIERELRTGEFVFPTSMQAAVMIRRALESDAGMSAVSKAISLEPVLSVKLLRMANSAFYNPSGTSVTDVLRALMRVGVNNARTLAFAVIGDQLATAAEFAPVIRLAEQLWRHSLDVASLSFAICVQLENATPDTAMLAGMVHDIGQFYLLSRAHDYPELLEEQSELAEFILCWDKQVGQAVLRSLGTPDVIVDALDNQDVCTGVWPPQKLSDIIFLANSAAGTPNPFSTVSLEDQLEMRRAAFKEVDPEIMNRLLDEARVKRAAALAMLAG